MDRRQSKYSNQEPNIKTASEGVRKNLELTDGQRDANLVVVQPYSSNMDNRRSTYSKHDPHIETVQRAYAQTWI
jgi:hypothetical protein